MITRKAGDEGVTWRIGIVRDTDDPLKLGRVRVQSISDNDDLKVEELSWAHILLPPTSPSAAGVGLSPTGITEGSHVLMIYLDGGEKQKPIVIGTFAKIPDMDVGKHDVSKLARGENNLKRSKLGPEPSSPYKAEYPYNKVLTTISGHAIEVDDTPGAERINIYHKSGSYIEIDSTGNRTDKIMNGHVDVTVKDKHIYVKGDCIIEGANITLKASSVKIESDELTHNGVNIGSDHVHAGVQSGSSKTGVPE